MLLRDLVKAPSSLQWPIAVFAALLLAAVSCGESTSETATETGADGGGAATDGASEVGSGDSTTGTGMDAACPGISAASFDQSCTQDSDCARVIVGNQCDCDFVCALSFAAINVSAQGAYSTAFTSEGLWNVTSSQLAPKTVPDCGCPDASTFEAKNPVCCIAGRCHADAACLPD